MGGEGEDLLSGQAGNDLLFGDEDDDHLDGGTGPRREPWRPATRPPGF